MNTFDVMRLIGDMPAEVLNCTETAILMRMILIGDRSFKNIKPGIIELSKKTKICERAVRNNLNSLIKKGILILSSIRKHGTRDMSCYEINVEALKEIISGKVPVSDAGRVPVCGAGTLRKVPVFNSKVPVSDAGRVPVCGAGTPYTTPFIQPKEPKYVEFEANSTSPFSEKISEDKNDHIESSNSIYVKEVFEHWKNVLNHPQSKLDEHRRRKISNALKRFSVDKLKKAIEGVKKTPWNMGKNPSKKCYHEIGLIFRNYDVIERFIGNFDIPPRVDNENVSTARKIGFFEEQRICGDLLRNFDPLRKKETQLKTSEDKIYELK